MYRYLWKTSAVYLADTSSPIYVSALRYQGLGMSLTGVFLGNNPGHVCIFLTCVDFLETSALPPDTNIIVAGNIQFVEIGKIPVFSFDGGGFWISRKLDLYEKVITRLLVQHNMYVYPGVRYLQYIVDV